MECEILGLSSSPQTGGAYALLLKEVYGDRRLPIIIGQFEAQAIALELEGIRPPRPLTHDLMKNIVERLGATIVETLITDLKENTFYAVVFAESAGVSNEIDSRPSDAIALAVRVNAPIYVNEKVLEEAAFAPDADGAPETTDLEVEAEEPAPAEPKTKEQKIERLQDRLKKALEEEAYEQAARLRDEIKKLSNNN